MPVGAYPGSFDPPTVAHLALADAACRQGGLDRVDLVLSREPLGKGAARAPLAARRAVLESVAAGRPWLGVRVTDARLVADLAEGYDAVVLGADKWDQVRDPRWYGSDAARDAAVARLPRLLVAPRGAASPDGLPPGALVLAVDDDHRGVSSTEAHAARRCWMLPEAVVAGWWG